MIDLDRLHEPHKTGRRSGRTFAMLVNVVQRADFGEQEVIVLVRNRAQIDHLRREVVKICQLMDYTGGFSTTESDVIWIHTFDGHLRIKFVTINDDRGLRGIRSAVFTDHWALEPGVPCKHLGCLSHVTHPCEGCGRTGGLAGRRKHH